MFSKAGHIVSCHDARAIVGRVWPRLWCAPLLQPRVFAALRALSMDNRTCSDCTISLIEKRRKANNPAKMTPVGAAAGASPVIHRRRHTAFGAIVDSGVGRVRAIPARQSSSVKQWGPSSAVVPQRVTDAIPTSCKINERCVHEACTRRVVTHKTQYQALQCVLR